VSAAEGGPRDSIARVGPGDLDELLVLMRAYCDFYHAAPSGRALLELSETLIGDSELEGLQLIARGEDGGAAGFATIFWSWSTTTASRIGVMNDLFVAAPARGRGLADRLIEACAAECAARGASSLQWVTELDNHRAQAIYDRVGAVRERWLDYSLEIPRTFTTSRSRSSSPTARATRCGTAAAR
jgi:GNAT superfamily N-acetyltransferase